jgi:hypothetical protein
MTRTSPRRADCPAWCNSDHRGTDPEAPVSHFGRTLRLGREANVGAALLVTGHAPEVILDRSRSPADPKPSLRTPTTWLRLAPSDAENLAAILDAAGAPRLAAPIRQVVADLT